jgi:predicted dehydrogenase
MARRDLKQRYGIECDGYLSLPALLAAQTIDVVAICSPAEVHLSDLEVAVEAGCHIFCEKPLWWPFETATDSEARAEIHRRATSLVDRCMQKDRFLALNTQWPFTLPAFRQLHPGAYGEDRPVRSFSMWLSPVSRGVPMVVDAAPHLLSMLQALLGPGRLQDIDTAFQDLPGLGARAQGLITLNYMHDEGETHVTFKLRRCPAVPRPAGYGINGACVERHIEPSNYVISFKNEGRRVPVRDPLAVCVEHFVDAMQTRRQPDRTSLVDGMTQLHELVAVAMSREQ